MPIEIKELIIRTNVEDSPRSSNNSVVDQEALRKEILDACDRKIKAALKQNLDR